MATLFGGLLAMKWRKAKFKRFPHQLCGMPDREDSYHISSPYHVRCTHCFVTMLQTLLCTIIIVVTTINIREQIVGGL